MRLNNRVNFYQATHFPKFDTLEIQAIIGRHLFCTEDARRVRPAHNHRLHLLRNNADSILCFNIVTCIEFTQSRHVCDSFLWNALGYSCNDGWKSKK